MAKIITSNNVVFMDTTDNRKLDVYITSNLPNAQIKNTNTNPITYTPNWISTPLKLEAGAYLDSQDVTSKTTFSWYKKGTDGREVLINANAQYITINTNDLDSSQLMVYICKALYKASAADTIGVEDVEQITFSQVTAGVDGIAGTDGEDGQTSYLHIAYATSSDGKTGFSVNDSVGKTYIGQYTDHTLSDSTDPTKYKWTLIKGDPGSAGTDAYTVLLTNEAHVFAGEVSNAINGGIAETQVLAYKGVTKQSVTISTINGKTAGTTDTDSGIAGLKFRCDAISGTDIKITFTCTNAFVSPNGTIPIVLTVGGVTFTKMFTYSIAFKGNVGGTGATGAAGSPATAYWLVSSASVIQKTTTGTIACTPSTLTFTGKSQTGTATPVDYAGRWVVSYSTDGSAYTTLYTSTSNEASKTITVATTYKTLKCQLYLAGGTTTLLDEQIIPVVTDGTPGTSASLVTITPSALYFKSTTGKDGTFSPDTIYLCPRFQNATYSNWQYSIDGGANWLAASGANGLTIGPYNSVANSLAVSKSSTLYTDTITSISFRCNSMTGTVYDVVSIAKIYYTQITSFVNRLIKKTIKN